MVPVIAVSRRFQLNISHLFTHLNDQTFLFLRIQFSISQQSEIVAIITVSLTIQLNMSNLFTHT